MAVKKQSAFSGLSPEEVLTSRKLNGGNSISKQKRQSFPKKFLEAFSDPIIKILCAALMINLLFALRGQGWFETAGIALSVFLSSFVSALSEYGSESAFLRLREEAEKTKARLMRNGKSCEVPCDDIVVGDIVFLTSGDLIPADGIIVSGSLLVDQSSVNGESAECEKHPLSSRDRGTLAGNTLFRGTVVTYGDALMEVTAVGDSTVFGQMAASLSETPRDSPLKHRLTGLAKTLSRLGYLAALLVALSDLFQRVFLDNGGSLLLAKAELCDLPMMAENLLHALTLAISIIIMAVPEGLPMMITVVLSGNMFKMLRDKVMVRKLSGIETAGSLNILFTDKTGTLTEGKPRILGFIRSDGEGFDLPDGIKRTLYISGTKNTSSRVIRSKPAQGNATDRVLLDFALSLGFSDDPGRTAFIPFSSETKYSAASVGNTAYIKGAPEKLLEKCTLCRRDSGQMLAFTAKERFLRRIETEGDKGHRLICICTAREMPKDGVLPDLCFECLAVIGDEVRPQAPAAVRELQKAGVQVVMVTGDNKNTAAFIARKCGIVSSDLHIILSGEQLSRLSDRKIAALLPNLAVVSRALPGDKSRLVRIAQNSGLVCGMTGDGINDAPALKLSDVGFAMGSGTDVAKEAGDIVITDDNISSICRAVLYGRTILRSIRRFIVFQMTLNMGAVGISLIGPFIGIETPVTVAQILWINLIMDTLAGLAFSGEPPLPEYMDAPPDDRSAPLMTRSMTVQTAFLSLWTVALCLIFLLFPRIRLIFPTEDALMTGFFALFIFTGIASAFCARTEKPDVLSGITKNKTFIAVMSAVAAVQLGLIYFGGEMFRSFGLSLPQLLFVLALSLTVIPAESVRKYLHGRKKCGKIKEKRRAADIL